MKPREGFVGAETSARASCKGASLVLGVSPIPLAAFTGRVSAIEALRPEKRAARRGAPSPRVALGPGFKPLKELETRGAGAVDFEVATTEGRKPKDGPFKQERSVSLPTLRGRTGPLLRLGEPVGGPTGPRHLCPSISAFALLGRGDGDPKQPSEGVKGDPSGAIIATFSAGARTGPPEIGHRDPSQKLPSSPRNGRFIIALG